MLFQMIVPIKGLNQVVFWSEKKANNTCFHQLCVLIHRLIKVLIYRSYVITPNVQFSIINDVSL